MIDPDEPDALDRMLDYCTFISPENPAEASTVLKVSLVPKKES